MKISRAHPSKLRVANRAREVAAVFVAHGLSDILEHLNLPSWLRGQGKEQFAGAEPSATLSSEDRFCQALEELGPTFVKLGQFLSTRGDLLPATWIQALSRLQDQVEEVPWAGIEAQLAESLGGYETLFSSIDEQPLAAGSIAQVHRASLRDGEQVVLKVLRPGIRKVIQADLEVLSLLASVAEERLAGWGLESKELVRQFARDRMDEIDLLHEGRSTDRLRRLSREDGSVIFPRVHWHVSTPKVLALEELQGTTFARLDLAKVSLATRHRLVQDGARAIVRQMLEFGFFHADPHPGNLMLLSSGQLAFIDCGIVGYLDSEQRRLLIELLEAVAEGDVIGLQHAATKLAECPSMLAEDRTLRRGLYGLLVDFDYASLESLDITGMLHKLFGLLREHKATIPPDLLKLVKALSALETLAERMAPDLNVVEEIARQSRELVVKRVGPAALKAKAWKLAGAYGSLLEELPRSLISLLEQARSQELGMKLTHTGLDRLTAALVFASRLLAMSMLVASLLVAGSIVLLAGRELPWLQTVGLVGLACALAFGGVVVVRHFRYTEP